jgi:hypothetical protein
MAVFKIIGTVIRTVENKAGRREERKENQYRLVRITGTKPTHVEPEHYKMGMARAIKNAADYLGFEFFTSAFVCNDYASNSTANMPEFSGYDNAVEVE